MTYFTVAGNMKQIWERRAGEDKSETEKEGERENEGETEKEREDEAKIEKERG